MVYKVKMNKNPQRGEAYKVKKDIPEFAKNDTLTEQQVNLIKRRMNDKKFSPSDIFSGEKNYKLTMDQEQKGLSWLKDKWLTPKGKERQDNPFGFREQNIIKNFSHYELIDYYDDVNYVQAQAGIKNYQPLYRVNAKDGNHFDYYISGGKIKIIG